MDASQYKDYVLTLLFMKYVSDKYAGDRDAVIQVPPGGSFSDMVKLKGHKEIGDKINKIIARLAEANDLKGVIDQADFNDEGKLGSGKEMQDRLSKLVAIFDGLDFRANRAEGDDLLGDAYEYLMRHFATDSGKSKGQFYTPAEVSRIMAQVVGIGANTRPDQTIYDPTCGSGSLLLKAADEAPRGITIYGQEMDVATWALARMNMILHGHPTAELWRANTISAPYFKDKSGRLKTFDFAVANPPFSAKAWSSGINPEHDEFDRFAMGVPPLKNGDFAFLLHLVASLKSKGKGAIILPHGVLFRGNREAEIRRALIQRGLIKGIIGLPANLFYGTGIPACILVIDKEHADSRRDHERGGIFMVDASRDFLKDGNKNRLRAQDLHKIVDVFTNQREVPRYARWVPLSEIASEANDYNLNLPRYIDASEPEDLHDLDAHLNGGIPQADIDALAPYWSVFPSLRGAVFGSDGTVASRPGYQVALVERRRVRQVILEHVEFTAFSARVQELVEGWCASARPMLRKIKVDDVPKVLIHDLSEKLLDHFADVELIDRYAVYQRLMDYWADVMQDDVYLIAADGWLDAVQPRAVIDDKARKIKETPDLVVGRTKYKMDVLPPALIVARFFAAEQAQIDVLQSMLDAASAAVEEYVESLAPRGDEEDGLLSEALTEKGKVTKASVRDRLRAIADEPGSDDERAALERCQTLLEEEADAERAVKAAQAALDQRVLDRYDALTDAEIKTLVVDDKWLASVRAAIDGEIAQLADRLAQRVAALDERYADPLPWLSHKANASSNRVEAHLRRLGIQWESVAGSNS